MKKKRNIYDPSKKQIDRQKLKFKKYWNKLSIDGMIEISTK
jgi:hypothetical protein